jgi:hypothetical protein
MTARRGFALHPLAAHDIEDIWAYIADDSPQAVRRVREEILAAMRALVPEEKPLWVVAVMHGRRSPRVMAAILRDRE